MKIIEARDGFINFEADSSIYLSSFVQAAGMDKIYIAQVNQMKKFGNILIASARILFLYDGHVLSDYDRTLPDKDAELSIFPADLLLTTKNIEKPVIVGKTLDNSNNIFMDLSSFNKRTLISVDDKEINNTLIQNLSKQFVHSDKNTIIIDLQGIVKGEKYIAGKDFKLPLDTSSLDFMYKSCLNDATDSSKATIAEVFKDLAEYSKAVPFVPFDVLKSIVDEMVDKQHIFKLFVLKNRLSNFERLGYFATEQSEVDRLDKIIASKTAVIDLSRLNPLFQNKFLDYIYAKLDAKNTQVMLEVSNNISKKNLKTIILDSDVPTTLISHSKFQFLSDIKGMFKNFIIEPSMSNNEIFKVYCTFFSSMQNKMYLIAGEDINYIAMVSTIQDIDDFIELEDVQSELEEVAEETVNDENDEIDQNNEKADAEEALSQEEIIAEIEEKSNNAIDNISENLEEQVEIDLFTDEDDEEIPDEESEEIQEDVEEVIDEAIEETVEHTLEQEISAEEAEQEDIIEPEYEEIADEQDSELIEESIEDLPEEFSEEELEEEPELETLTEDVGEKEFADDIQYTEAEDISISAEPEEILLEEDNSSDVAIENVDSEELQTDDEVLFVDNNDEDLSIDDTNLTINDDNEDLEEDLSIELTNDEELLIDEAESELIESDEEKASPELETDLDELSVIPLGDQEQDQNYDEEEEVLSDDDIKEDDIVINMQDDIVIDEEVDRQIVEDVDKVFTTMKNTEELEEISDSDLDLIDALNSDEEELEEYHGELEEVSDSDIDTGILDQPTESIVPPRQPQQDDSSEILERKESNTPIVPVYDADIPQEDMVLSDSIQQGDSVVHAKYGNGVVEKMIKYGTKTLYSINFENIGRRLLDPTLTEIKKL